MKLMSTTAAVILMMSAAPFSAAQAPPTAAQEQRSVQEQQRRDQLRAAVQEICPVSGGKLGSMGEPVKVKVGEETVFMCCKGCLNQKIKPEHWATIHANIAKAQGICPVMKKGLPKKPKWTIIEGQIVYICCPGCDKKIIAKPQQFLRQVDQLYLAALDAKKRAQQVAR